MTSTAIGAICSIVFGALGFVISYFTFTRSKDKDNTEEGQTRGVMASDIGYIKAGVDDLKRDAKETRTTINNLSERVTRCEESCKQAHKRIDEIHDTEVHK